MGWHSINVEMRDEGLLPGGATLLGFVRPLLCSWSPKLCRSEKVKDEVKAIEDKSWSISYAMLRQALSIAVFSRLCVVGYIVRRMVQRKAFDSE